LVIFFSPRTGFKRCNSTLTSYAAKADLLITLNINTSQFSPKTVSLSCAIFSAISNLGLRHKSSTKIKKNDASKLQATLKKNPLQDQAVKISISMFLQVYKKSLRYGAGISRGKISQKPYGQIC